MLPNKTKYIYQEFIIYHFRTALLDLVDEILFFKCLYHIDLNDSHCSIGIFCSFLEIPII